MDYLTGYVERSILANANGDRRWQKTGIDKHCMMLDQNTSSFTRTCATIIQYITLNICLISVTVNSTFLCYYNCAKIQKAF